MRIRGLLIVSALGAISGGAAAVPDTVSVKDQAISNNTVTATAVTANKPGYLVVHRVTGSTVDGIIGVAAINAGENSNVSVSLTASVKPDEKLIFFLHEESNGNTKYDPSADKFVVVNGFPVASVITVLK
jgi:hypothetical protein